MDTDLSTSRFTISSPASSSLSRQCRPLMDTAMLAAAIVLLASIKCSAMRTEKKTRGRKTLVRAMIKYVYVGISKCARNCAKQVVSFLFVFFPWCPPPCCTFRHVGRYYISNTSPVPRGMQIDWTEAGSPRREWGRTRNYKRHIIKTHKRETNSLAHHTALLLMPHTQILFIIPSSAFVLNGRRWSAAAETD